MSRYSSGRRYRSDRLEPSERHRRKLEQQRQWRKRNPEKLRAYNVRRYREHCEERKSYGRRHYQQNPGLRREQKLKQLYGLTLMQYNQMLVRQGGVCAVCLYPPKKRQLAVEHDHKTGRVRCLACYRCNRYRIGMNTADTTRRILAILESTFDGRQI